MKTRSPTAITADLVWIKVRRSPIRRIEMNICDVDFEFLLTMEREHFSYFQCISVHCVDSGQTTIHALLNRCRGSLLNQKGVGDLCGICATTKDIGGYQLRTGVNQK